ncbi:unnamed protein product, partial [Rotaria magnacalcarata]
HMINENGISPCPDKVRAINDIPMPRITYRISPH